MEITQQPTQLAKLHGVDASWHQRQQEQQAI
jgi:hypothetical protein